MQKYPQEQLREMKIEEAEKYAEEIRRFLVENVTVTGGHLASNLGVVEISLALARNFSLAKDRIIYDTGHQSYVHKLLTQRAEQFSTLRQFGGISGFPRRSESPCDAFGVGHSSTSVSAAVGFCQAQELLSPDEPYYSVAVIGDGAFTGGMVFEALNNVKKNSRLILILNDNKMSISPSVGALSRYLDRIRQQDGYYDVMEKSRKLLKRIPLVGASLTRGLISIKRKIKRMTYAQSNLFELYGIRYFGPADGNDLKAVERLIRVAKKGNTPCIIHLHTTKGKGYLPAETDPSAFHSVGAKKKSGALSCDCFSSVVGETLCRLAEEEPSLVALTAAMCDGVGLTEFARRYPQRFFDVGIAEEHAVTCCAAMGAAGLLPVFCVYSTFFQRAYDSFLHDAALQKLKCVMILDRAGIVGEDGPTHHGLFDVSMTLNLPGVLTYSPASYQELTRCLTMLCAKTADGWLVPSPAVVRIPRGRQEDQITKAFPCEEAVERFSLSQGEDCVILSYGRIVGEALKACALLEERGIHTAVVKVTQLQPLDGEALREAVGSCRLLYVLEEGMRRGGWGEAVVSDAAMGRLRLNCQRMFVRGVEDFVPHGAVSRLLEHCGLDGLSVAREIGALL